MFGQIPDFTNGFEFLRNLWGAGSGMPNGLMPGLQAMTPPMDLDEVDKRIHDLKAVESWLQLNVNLLRTTIQGLEVQRATLVALQTFGKALSPDAMQSAMENVARAANAPSATPHHHPFTMPTRAPEPESVDDEEEEEDDDIEYPPDLNAADAEDGEDGAGDDENTEALPDDGPVEGATDSATDSATEGATDSATDSGTELPPNAALWWNLLQQQFNQIASSAAAASMVPFGNLGGMNAAAPATGTGTAAAGPGAWPSAQAATPAKKTAAKQPTTRTASARKPATKQAAAKKAAAKKAAAKKATAKKPAAKANTKADMKADMKADTKATPNATPKKPTTQATATSRTANKAAVKPPTTRQATTRQAAARQAPANAPEPPDTDDNA
ncbi:PhaM family polyhydroxyalkanoate granule multifunctional regulatory protein [Cupriavidus sp. OTU4054]|uniref:PhaM family polyhydroxyalkanoate granule multifunctional regulatory protein n=1 Tax=unclassified Cupriavidus TaxID=2640874 RepID=UPI00406CAB83